MIKATILVTLFFLSSNVKGNTSNLFFDCSGLLCQGTDYRFRCYDFAAGVCCGDSVCPVGFICENRRNCKPKGDIKAFLSEGKVSINNSLSTLPQIVLGPAIELTEGLVEGLDVFEIQDHAELCFEKAANPELFQDITKIIDLIKSLNIEKDFVNTVKQIYDTAVSTYVVLEDAVAPCTNYAEELERTRAEFIQYITKEDHWLKALEHALFNVEKLKTMITSLNSHVSEKDYKNMGKDLGGIIKFLLYWDFKVDQI